MGGRLNAILLWGGGGGGGWGWDLNKLIFKI